VINSCLMSGSSFMRSALGVVEEEVACTGSLDSVSVLMNGSTLLFCTYLGVL
jgi:hypothetical protein